MKSLALTVAFVASLSLMPSGLLGQAQEQVYEAKPGSGVTLPKPIREVKPHYSPGAMKEQVQGTVWLKCVVRTNGKPSDIEVAKALHPELDQQAIAALQQWEFTPGSRDGKPVSVRITVELTFTLK